MLSYKKIYILFIVLFFSIGYSYSQTPKNPDFQKQNKKETQSEILAKQELSLALDIKKNYPDSAIILGKKSLKYFTQQNNKFQIAAANLILSQSYNILSQREVSKIYLDSSFQISSENNYDSLKAMGYLLYAEYFKTKGEYEKSIEYAHSGMRLFQKINQITGVIKAKGIKAQIYQMKGDLEMAETLLKEIINQPYTDANSQINGIHTLANIYGMQGKYKDALALDARGLTLCEKENFPNSKSMFYDNMANCYMYSNQLLLAEKYFYKTLEIDSAIGDKKQMSDTYLNLGQLHLRRGNYTTAIKDLQKSIELSKAAGYRQGTYQAYLLLSDAFKNINTDSAYNLLKIAYKVKDSIINESSENKIAELETLYQKDKKEQQLALQESKLTQKNYLLAGLLALITLLIVSGFYIYKRRQIKNQLALQSTILKQQEESSKAILIAEDRERSRISAELHDGVGQLMSAAKMNLSAFESEINFSSDAQKKSFTNLLSLIDEGCKEVRNVSHQMMPGALEKYGLEKALKEMVQQIDSKILNIDLHVEGLENKAEDHINNILYRIIQEGINNTLKHAKATELHISLEKDEEAVRLSIEDNGVGFNTDQKGINGIGLENIYSRVQYLKGTLDLDSKENEGTLIAIFIPLK